MVLGIMDFLKMFNEGSCLVGSGSLFQRPVAKGIKDDLEDVSLRRGIRRLDCVRRL